MTRSNHKACRNKRIAGLKRANERQADRVTFVCVLDFKHLGKPVDLSRDEPERVAGAPDRNEFEAIVLCFGGDARTAFTIHINDGDRARRQQFGEQPELLGEIVLEARMIV